MKLVEILEEETRREPDFRTPTERNDSISKSFWKAGYSALGVSAGKYLAIKPGVMDQSYTEEYQVPANIWGFFICSNEKIRDAWYDFTKSKDFIQFEKRKPVLNVSYEGDDMVDAWHKIVKEFRDIVLNDQSLLDQLLAVMMTMISSGADPKLKKYLSRLEQDKKFKLDKEEASKFKSIGVFMKKIGEEGPKFLAKAAGTMTAKEVVQAAYEHLLPLIHKMIG